MVKSRPVWGAWIEINRIGRENKVKAGRAPYGARGLKYLDVQQKRVEIVRRAPYGARGLKCGAGLCRGPGK